MSKIKRYVSRVSKDKQLATIVTVVGTTSVMSWVTKNKETYMDAIVGAAGLGLGLSKLTGDYSDAVSAIGAGSLSSFAARKSEYTGPLVILGAGALTYLLYKENQKALK